MQDADEDEGDFDESEPEDMDEIVWAPTQPTKYIKDLEKSTDCVDLAAASTLADTMVTNISMSLEDVEQKLHCLVAPESHLRLGTCASTLWAKYPDFPTRVRLLQQSIGNDEVMEQRYESAVPVLNDEYRTHDTPDMPLLDQVSLATQLNEKQHKMFANVGKKLLKSLLLGHDVNEQIVAFLGGKPGAGKSRVIGALQVLAQKWKSEESIATCAYQGVAAQAANEQTIHKLFG
ncbi:hypothetical protein GN958_ATG11149 [Phytophthora infestans]|uniref:DNA helicase n=1 Tax=Phytophthora infestans TaxID=4787 RepID=A0A8S9UKX0_PHYIN|nr:hypothetical protein GN958_ATG11149 [Phytophthora infestans]